MSESKPKSAQDIYTEALKLSVEERELLVAMLEQNDSPGWASPEIEQAWMEELARRRKLMDEGKVGFVDGEKFLNELRQKYAL